MLFTARSKLAAGGLPGQEIMEGFMLAIGGALLLTPGFITDAVGFSLLIPPLRHGWVRTLKKHFVIKGAESPRPSDQKTSGPANDRVTIDGEYRRED